MASNAVAKQREQQHDNAQRRLPDRLSSDGETLANGGTSFSEDGDYTNTVTNT